MQVYLDKILWLHRVPTSIVSNRDTRFVPQFWRSWHKALGTPLNFSIAFYSQTNGQSDRTIQILEKNASSLCPWLREQKASMLRMVEFTYNNSYNSSHKMALFEVSYVRKCPPPLHWSKVGEGQPWVSMCCKRPRRMLELRVNVSWYVKSTKKLFRKEAAWPQISN